MPVESLSASYDSLIGEEEEEVLSGESLMYSHTVSLQICVQVCACVWGLGNRQITIMNYACPSAVRASGWGGTGTSGCLIPEVEKISAQKCRFLRECHLMPSDVSSNCCGLRGDPLTSSGHISDCFKSI